MIKTDFEKYESELWQIVRMHSFDIKINIELTPDYGDVMYYCTLTVCGVNYTLMGRNLWKRYKKAVKILTRLYGDNLYKYGTKPLNP